MKEINRIINWINLRNLPRFFRETGRLGKSKFVDG